ncbi:CehA/McbA family metallohydrolase [Spongiactinospora sp. TRM90649]|uniref:CehA/McbA family metallohydrolase n=1 Tax=Spongiactinospora sp. TRM90649 TaxID=3031114 RepID=UPI0023F7448F|nr:CehA/McbA family metallohydrolase [Spongiactinospora sp. TRM90649]MDF5758210.1 CehA/McbA family metallohydrolase [Spongiactinospora sp. TRM90649]
MEKDPLLPGQVAREHDEYRELLAEHGLTWGEDPIAYVQQIRTSPYLTAEHDFWGVLVDHLRAAAAGAHPGPDPGVAAVDMDEVIRDALHGQVMDNLAVLRISHERAVVDALPRAVLHGGTLATDLLVDSSRERPVVVTVDGEKHEVRAGGARILRVTSDATVKVDGEAVRLGALTRRAEAATLRVRAGFPCRWTVVGGNGQGWYPPGAPHRRDYHRMPYFHGDDMVLDVPAEPLTVRVTRGMEYGVAETVVFPSPGRETLVDMTPERIYDAPARGWYGGDMHVHLNWAGDVVGTPADAAAVQHGEDLHVLNLVAGNVATDRVYDAEALRHWAGRDLPWSDATHIGRMGVEYRNDLLGHFFAFGVTAPPRRFHSGFTGDRDWPPNHTACAELRGLGAVTGYSHPFHCSSLDELDHQFGSGRSCSAREIVADAALGLIDALDVVNHSSITGTAVIYRRLLGAGNRLAATAGTDTMLSFTRRGSQSAPPGWGRVYAKVDGPLSAASFADAIRRGRTFATTGPWLELSVADAGPGDTLRLPGGGGRVGVTVRAIGPEVERLEIRTADGIAAEGPPGELSVVLDVTEPTYVLAVASGGPHPRAMRADAYACTSPVHIEVAGRSVAREEDLRWCLAWLDRLETLIRTEGGLAGPVQLSDHLALYDRARAVYRSRLPGH